MPELEVQAPDLPERELGHTHGAPSLPGDDAPRDRVVQGGDALLREEQVQERLRVRSEAGFVQVRVGGPDVVLRGGHVAGDLRPPLLPGLDGPERGGDPGVGLGVVLRPRDRPELVRAVGGDHVEELESLRRRSDGFRHDLVEEPQALLRLENHRAHGRVGVYAEPLRRTRLVQDRERQLLADLEVHLEPLRHRPGRGRLQVALLQAHVVRLQLVAHVVQVGWRDGRLRGSLFPGGCLGWRLLLGLSLHGLGPFFVAVQLQVHLLLFRCELLHGVSFVRVTAGPASVPSRWVRRAPGAARACW